MRDIKALRFAKNTCETSCAMTTLGYARVSTQDQNLSGQIEALKAAGATTIYRERISGVRADRLELAKLMAKIAPGDIVVVTKLDRLGRSTRDSEAGAAFRSLGDPLWDTASSQGKLLRTLLAAIRRITAGEKLAVSPRATLSISA